MRRNQKSKLKILFICEYFPTSHILNVHGGVEFRTYLLSRELAKKHKITVIASLEKNTSRFQKINTVSILRVGVMREYTQQGDWFKRLIFVFSAVLQAKDVDFDLVEGSGLLGQISALAVGLIYHKTKVAFIPDAFSLFPSYFGKLGGLILKFFEKIIFNNYWNSIIVISNTVKNKLSRFKIKSEKMYLIYCGIDKKQYLNQKVKLSPYPSICIVNRLVSYKNTDTIVNSAKLLIKDYPKMRVNIIGDGPELMNLKNLAEDLNLKENIRFIGFIPDHSKMLRFMKSCWIYCSASTIEGFGITTIEAMTLKIPYVITDTLINREITKSKGGLFSMPMNTVDLSFKIKKILDNYQMFKRNTTKNYQVTDKYDLNMMVKKTERLYKKLIYFQ